MKQSCNRLGLHSQPHQCQINSSTLITVFSIFTTFTTSSYHFLTYSVHPSSYTTSPLMYSLLTNYCLSSHFSIYHQQATVAVFIQLIAFAKCFQLVISLFVHFNLLHSLFYLSLTLSLWLEVCLQTLKRSLYLYQSSYFKVIQSQQDLFLNQNDLTQIAPQEPLLQH